MTTLLKFVESVLLLLLLLAFQKSNSDVTVQGHESIH